MEMNNLSMADITRIFRAVTFVEKLAREPFNINSVTGFNKPVRRNTSEGWPVKVTGARVTSPPEDAGLYPGTMYLPDPTALPPWAEQDCWIREIPDYQLAIGDVGIGRLVGMRATEETEDEPAKRTPIYAMVGSESYTPEPPISGDPCVTWYTSYLHLGSVAVYEGQSIRPRQRLGFLGPYSTGAHLHFSLGDGDQSQNPVAGSITAGVATDIESWIAGLGYPIDGVHVGVLPSPAADFSGPELIVIQNHFAFPLETTLPWHGLVSSPFHTGWDYWGMDFNIPSTDVQGQPVYAAFTGDNVNTTVTYCGYTPSVGWVVILKHQAGVCEEDGGADENITPRPYGPGLTIVNGAPTINHNNTLQIVNNQLGINLAVLCLQVQCCLADALEVATTATPNYGVYPLEVDFTATPTGGVGPYTYLWDFDVPGETSTLQNPTFTFEQVGVYEVVLTVTDACGNVVEETVWIYVGEACVCGFCAAGYAEGYSFTLAGGTGDFATANGAWEIYHTGGCSWVGHLGAWSIVANFVSSTIIEVTLSNGTNSVDWVVNITNCCGPFADETVDFVTSVGTGTVPTFSDPGIAPIGACNPCCTTYEIDGATSLAQSTPTTWTDGSSTLTYSGGGAWSLSHGGCTYTATGWDGAGCKTFTLTAGDCAPTVEVCCADA